MHEQAGVWQCGLDNYANMVEGIASECKTNDAAVFGFKLKPTQTYRAIVAIGVGQRESLPSGSDNRIIYYWDLTKGSFTCGIRQKDTLLLGPRQKDSLLLGSDNCNSYYWGPKESFIIWVRHRFSPPGFEGRPLRCFWSSEWCVSGWTTKGQIKVPKPNY